MTRTATLLKGQPLSPRNTELIVEQKGRMDKSLVRDASPRDLLITSQMVLDAGENVCFRMQSGFPLTMTEFIGAIHWTNRSGIPAEYGIALASNAPPELLLNTSASLDRELRFRCRVVGELIVPKQADPIPALVINYSRAGCCLVTKVNVPTGTEIFFIFRHPKHLNRIRLRVRWSSSNNHEFLIGCQNSNRTQNWAMADFDVPKRLNGQ